jgi:hypothetical protein
MGRLQDCRRNRALTNRESIVPLSELIVYTAKRLFQKSGICQGRGKSMQAGSRKENLLLDLRRRT